MRTTLSGLATLAIVITTVGAVRPALALDDAATLRCEAELTRVEGRFFGCAARCREQADQRAAAGLAYDQSRCDGRCDRRYNKAVSHSTCVARFPERIAAPETAGFDAQTLTCLGIAGTLGAKFMRCLASCADLAEFAALRGFAFDVQTCVDGCTEIDAARVAQAEEQSDCVLSN